MQGFNGRQSVKGHNDLLQWLGHEIDHHFGINGVLRNVQSRREQRIRPGRIVGPTCRQGKKFKKFQT